MRLTETFLSLSFCLLVGSCVMHGQRTIRIPGDSPTIQAGVDSAADGDTVLVGPGTYLENLKVDSKSVTVRSTDGAAQTILDGSRKAPVVSLTGMPTNTVVIDGFTIQDGGTSLSPSDGGVSAQSVSYTVQNSIVKGNYGYGIHSIFSRATLLNNHISVIGPGTPDTYCSVYAIGGIDLSGTGATSTDAAGTSRIANNVIEGDGTVCSGPGINVGVTTHALIEDNVIHDARSGIHVSDETRPDISLHAIVRQNLVYHNRYTGLDFDYFYFFGNADNGYEPVTMTAVNNTVVGNMTQGRAVDNAGYPVADVLLENSFARVSLVNNLIVGTSANTPVIDCDIFGANPNVVPPVFDHNDIINVAASPVPSFLNNCGYGTSFFGINGNISVDPRFVSAADFHVSPGSAAVDGGNTSAIGLATSDFSGNARVQDVTGSGYPTVDMGAYEAGGVADRPLSTLGLTSSIYYQVVSGPATLTAVLTSPSGPVVGPVTFLEDDVSLGTVEVDATGRAMIAPLVRMPGIYRFTATYAGDAGHSPAVSQVIYARLTGISPTLPTSTTAITCAPNPSFPDQSIVFNSTTTIGGTRYSNGAVTYADGNTNLQRAVVLNGLSSFTTKLSKGLHSVTATFDSFTGSYAPSSAACAEQVVGYPTATTLTTSLQDAAYGQAVTFTAAVTSQTTMPTGAVTFLDGGMILASVALDASQHASYTTSALMPGTHAVTAMYTGNVLLAESTSAALSQVIDPVPSDFSLRFDTQTLTVRADQQGTANAVLTSVGGFMDSIDLSCAGLPFAASCTFATNPVSLTQGGAATVAVHVATNVPLSSASVLSGGELGWGVSGVFAAAIPGLFVVGLRRKRRLGFRLLVLLVAAGVIGGISGCSGKSPKPTPPGTYTITVTARGRSTQETHTTDFTLVVTR